MLVYFRESKKKTTKYCAWWFILEKVKKKSFAHGGLEKQLQKLLQ